MAPSVSFGRASDLNEYLTGPSVSLSGNRVGVGWNATSRGYGVGVGPSGPGATYGLPRFNVRDIPSFIGKLPTLLYPRGPFQETYPMP